MTCHQHPKIPSFRHLAATAAMAMAALPSLALNLTVETQDGKPLDVVMVTATPLNPPKISTSGCRPG